MGADIKLPPEVEGDVSLVGNTGRVEIFSKLNIMCRVLVLDLDSFFLLSP